MKKILLLATVMMLFAAVGLVADVSFSGNVRVRAAQATDGGPGNYSNRGWILANVSGDYNTGLIRVQAGGPNADEDNYNAVVGRAHFTTDVSGWLAGEFGVELPVGITNQMGRNEYGFADVAANTMYEFEALGENGLLTMSKYTGVGNRVNVSVMDMANIYVATSLDPVVEGKWTIAGVDSSVDVGVGTVMAEVVFNRSDDNDSGVLGFGFAFSSDELVEGMSGTIGGSVWVPVDAEDDDPAAAYGVGASIGYGSLVNASVSYRGYSDSDDTDYSNFRFIGLGLTSAPVDFLTIGAGLQLNLTDDDFEAAYGGDIELMQAAEIWAALKAGATTFTVGYFWLEDDQGLGAVSPGADFVSDYSNVYLTAQMSF